MGVSISRYSDLTNNEYLLKFCSKDHISSNDPFWNRLLAYNITPPKNRSEQELLDEATVSLLRHFVNNNEDTCNLGSLVQVFITRATELLASPTTDNVVFAWQTFNALFIIRCVTKYLVETLPEHQLRRHFEPYPEKIVTVLNGPIETSCEVKGNDLVSNGIDEAQTFNAERKSPSTDVLVNLEPVDTTPVRPAISSEQVYTANGGESKLEVLIDALVGLIIDVPVTDNTYYLHLEALNSLLVLLSVYLFAHIYGPPAAVEKSLIYRTVFSGRYSLHAGLLIKTLLQQISLLKSAPTHLFGYGEGGGSMVLGLASGIWSLLTLSASSNKNLSILESPPKDKTELMHRLCTYHAVANQSCLLLLVLTNHCLGEHNMYRKALFSTEDIVEPLTSSQAAGTSSTGPKVSLSLLRAAMSACAGADAPALLHYLLMHGTPSYRRHMADVAPPDQTVIPIMQNLYNAPASDSHHIYMSLIILLMLTEDDRFNRQVHQIIIKNPTWYTERSLTEISLGGLMILVIIRTVQYNMLKVRDKYLHTNCLAALANMSGEFRNLHPYVAQRLVSLFETLSKKYTRIMERVNDKNEVSVPIEDAPLSDEAYDDMVSDSVVLEEVLRTLLEIINSCLCTQLPNNVNLVYALLYKRHVFSKHKDDAAFHDIVQNIEMVVGYFSTRLQRVQEHSGGELGVTEVLQTIKKGAEQWSDDRLRKFPELRFRYVEEENPEEFFTPYVWTLVEEHASVFWSTGVGSSVPHGEIPNLQNVKC